MLVALFASAALADTLTLDSGAVIEGDLARYQLGGDCQITVTEGELSGVIVIVPCHRVQSFVRTTVRPPAPIGLPAPAAPSPAAEPEPALAVEVPAPAVPAPLSEPEYTLLADEPLIPVFETPVADEAPAPSSAEPAPPARATLPVSGPAEMPAEAPGQPRSAPSMGEMPSTTRPIRF